jgi:hypothetical protein
MNLYDEFLKEWSELWFQYILDHPEILWDYNRLSYNSNITWDIVQTHADKPWDYNRLSENKMNNSKDLFIRKKHQEWFRKSKLYDELMTKVWHPSNMEKWKYYDIDLTDDINLFD